MARPAKIIGTARLIVAKYGKAGPMIARRRARQAARQRHEAAASAWTAIARAADVVLEPPPDDRASLSDVLDGAVTGQVMNAYGVEREQVEQLMRQTKKRREAKSDIPPKEPARRRYLWPPRRSARCASLSYSSAILSKVCRATGSCIASALARTSSARSRQYWAWGMGAPRHE